MGILYGTDGMENYIQQNARELPSGLKIELVNNILGQKNQPRRIDHERS